ncbi:MAG: ABC transporter ATP-binding protein [Planctomycetes bacterium]|nr:ABC transporter ATP-binding protein [Planctomycetota bacterium]
MGGGDDVLLSLEDLRTHFFTDAGVVKAVDGVSYRIPKGRTLGVVGESGCGKSVTALSIMRLIPDPPGRIVGGRILLDGEDLAQAPLKRMRSIRGKDIGMIFQEPMTSLNPVFTVGYQIMEPAVLHLGASAKKARELAIDVLAKVGIPAPERRVDEYPHQLSGGMRQRVMIAMSLVCNPRLLIADEPTTALDVTIQAQILDLIRKLQTDYGMSVLIITHDLGIVAEISHDVAVMYAGKIVEYADVATLFKRPVHPYTIGLFHARPKIGEHKARLSTITGEVPNPLAFPSGCKFHPRCPFATERCKREEPPLSDLGNGHKASCWLIEEGRPASLEQAAALREAKS